jgi:hypothetical protein
VNVTSPACAAGPVGPSAAGHTSTTGDAGRATDLRAFRKRAQSVLRSLTTVKRVRHCGWVGVGQEVAVMASHTSSGLIAGVAGTQTCGSVWACPTCAAKIAAHRTADLEKGISRWLAPSVPWRGGLGEDGSPGSMMLVTLTIRHHQGQALASTWDLVSSAWRRMVGHRDYKTARKSMGVAGYHRTTEVTNGANGWHVHLHVLYFLRGTAGDDAVSAAGARIVSRWMQSVVDVGGSATLLGQDYRQLRGTPQALNGVAGYVNKGVYVQRPTGQAPRSASSVALEVSRSDLKRARRSSRSPFEVLADIVTMVEEDGVVNAEDAA